MNVYKLILTSGETYEIICLPEDIDALLNKIGQENFKDCEEL